MGDLKYLKYLTTFKETLPSLSRQQQKRPDRQPAASLTQTQTQAPLVSFLTSPCLTSESFHSSFSPRHSLSSVIIGHHHQIVSPIIRCRQLFNQCLLTLVQQEQEEYSRRICRLLICAAYRHPIGKDGNSFILTRSDS